MDPLFLTTSFAIGYIMGSIPFGMLIAMFAGEGDIRNIGSGNIGATNVLRTGRKDLAALTLVLDALKAAIPVLVVHSIVQTPYSLIAGAAALMGHCFPVWLKFKGGKGVATFFGAVTAAAWPVGLFAAATWLLMAFTFKYSSLAALTAAGASPLVALAFGKPQIAVWAAILALMVFIRHSENIRRLISGQEPKIGQGKKDTDATGE